MIDLEAWSNCCVEAFNGNDTASNFITHMSSNFETLQPDNKNKEARVRCTFSDSDKQNYRIYLTAIGCYPKKKSIITVPYADWKMMDQIKRDRRMEWHTKTQRILKEYFFEQLRREPTVVLNNISDEQRFKVFQEFYNNNKSDLAREPFFKSLFGLFNFQYRNKNFVSEWRMSQFKLTQTEQKETIGDYLRLLKGALGLQCICLEGEDVVWLIDDTYLTDPFLKMVRKLGPKTQVSDGECRLTNIPRQCEGFLAKWSYYLLSLVHQQLK